MIAHIIIRYKKLLIAVFFIHFSFCASSTEQIKINIAGNESTPFMEIAESDFINLFWDAPLKTTDTIDYYELFYRTERENGWTRLDTTIFPGPNLQIRIYRSKITSNDSAFFFAVRGVTKSGTKTDFLFSSDSSAVPVGGWFLFWK
jgi:hypothetical protein